MKSCGRISKGIALRGLKYKLIQVYQYKDKLTIQRNDEHDSFNQISLMLCGKRDPLIMIE